MSGMRVLLCTLGSLGDLHPYLALARELVARGDRAVLATSELYRERVRAEGVEFHPIRPDLAFMLDQPARMARYMDTRHGSERVIRELVLPHLAAAYADTLAAAHGADLLVTHPLTLVAPMVAEVLGLPWVATVLAPVSYMSAHDPPVFPAMEWTESLRWLPAPFHRRVLGLAETMTAGWFGELHALRARLGLPPVGHPIFSASVSPFANLGLFSPVFGPPQPDWPPRTHATGYCFLDHPRLDHLPETLARFLGQGPPPLVFTLGTSAIWDARDFYRCSLAHARALGRRAVLLTGRDTGNAIPLAGEDALVVDYVPYSRLFPHAAAIVHQGGAGTTAEALRAGRPMLVVPFSHDQFDNAARVRRIGSGDTLARRRYGGRTGRERLARLLGSERIATQAAAHGARIRAEDGPGRAIAVLAGVLAGDRARGVGVGPAG
jgi:UDP:flavonoid glycosyltransferase YjiC (YdhE family)